MGGFAEGQDPGRGGEQLPDGGRLDGPGDVLDVVGHGFNRIVEPSVETLRRKARCHGEEPSNDRTAPARRPGPSARAVDAGRQELRGGGDPAGGRAHVPRLPHLHTAARARLGRVPRAAPGPRARDGDVDHAGREPGRTGGGVPSRRREPRPTPPGPADAASRRRRPARPGAHHAVPERRRDGPRRRGDVRGAAGARTRDQARHPQEVGAGRDRDSTPRPGHRVPGVRGGRRTGRTPVPPAPARRLPAGPDRPADRPRAGGAVRSRWPPSWATGTPG